MRTRQGICILIVAWTTTLTSSAQGPEWRLKTPLSDVDKASVLALAVQLGIERPAVIRHDVTNAYVGCDYLRIESVPSVHGERRTFRRAYVSRAELKCPAANVAGPGKWVAAFPDAAREVGVWRVTHGDASWDVETPSTVTYNDVMAIVTAVGAGRLENGLPVQYRAKFAELPTLNARSVAFVSFDHHDPALYRVSFADPNVVLIVAVTGKRVELRSWAREYA